MAEAQSTLWPENAEVWGLYQRIVSRFLVDTGSMAVAIRAACDGLTPDDTLDRLARFGIIYDAIQPKPK